MAGARTDSRLQLDYYAFESYVNECDFKCILKFKLQLHIFYKSVETNISVAKLRFLFGTIELASSE